MPPYNVLAFGAVLVGVAAVRGWKAMRAERRRRAVNRTAGQIARSTIAAAREGEQVRLVGAVLDQPEHLIAPITGRRCVAFHAVIESASQELGEVWSPYAQERAAVDFAITDGSGRAIVEAATTRFDWESSRRGGATNDLPPSARELLARQHFELHARPLPKKLRYVERALEIGTEVAVVGWPVREPDRDAPAHVTGYREGPPTRLRFTGTPTAPVFVSDDPEAAG